MPRLSHLSPLSLLGLALVLTSCSGGSTQPGPGTTPPPQATWHKDVAPLMQAKCGTCHTEGGIAPIPLQTYDQVYRLRSSVKSAVEAHLMPPWPPSADCNSYTQDRSLTQEQIDLLSRWVDEGATEGDPADAPAVTGSPLVGGLSRVDVQLQMPTEYVPQKIPDEYRCFILDWPETQTRYITGFRADPGNATNVHHVIAFLAKPNEVADYQARDAKDPGAGYTCFGGPGGDGRGTWIGGWAPGSLGSDFPAGTGLRIDPGSKVVLQVHYHAHGLTYGPDRSSVAFKVDPAVDKLAIVQPWTNPDWLRGTNMAIPAGQADVKHAWAFEPTPVMGYITSGVFKNNLPITVYSVGLHMHTRGTHARLEVVRSSGRRECLLDIPRWDFGWQGSYGLAQPTQVWNGDQLSLECHWDNSASGATDRAWGEGTDDEMCLGIFYMTQ